MRIKPDATYSFISTPYSAGKRFVIQKHTGVLIPDFTPELISPKWIKQFSSEKYFGEHPCIFLLKEHPQIQLFYYPETSDYIYGTYRNNALLIKHEKKSKTVSKLTIWFFKGVKIIASSLHRHWLSNSLELSW